MHWPRFFWITRYSVLHGSHSTLRLQSRLATAQNMYTHYERQLPDIYAQKHKTRAFFTLQPWRLHPLSPQNGSTSWHAWGKKRVRAVSHAREQFAEFAPKTITRSSVTAKSTARPSCLVGVLYDIYRETNNRSTACLLYTSPSPRD